MQRITRNVPGIYKIKSSCEMYVILRFVVVYDTILRRRDMHAKQPHQRQQAQQPQRQKGPPKPQQKQKQQRNNSTGSIFSGKTRMEYKCRIRVKTKTQVQKRQRSRWKTTTDALSSCVRGDAQPSKKRRLRPADHVIHLQWYWRYPRIVHEITVVV